jgi:hypothetical protein
LTFFFLKFTSNYYAFYNLEKTSVENDFLSLRLLKVNTVSKKNIEIISDNLISLLSRGSWMGLKSFVWLLLFLNFEMFNRLINRKVWNLNGNCFSRLIYNSKFKKMFTMGMPHDTKIISPKNTFPKIVSLKKSFHLIFISPKKLLI